MELRGRGLTMVKPKASHVGRSLIVPDGTVCKTESPFAAQSGHS